MAMRALGFEPKKEEIKKMIADIDKVSARAIAAARARKPPQPHRAPAGRPRTQPPAAARAPPPPHMRTPAQLPAACGRNGREREVKLSMLCACFLRTALARSTLTNSFR